MKKLLSLISVIFLGAVINAQEEFTSESGRIHKIAVVMGLTHIPSAIEDGKKSEAVFVPTIGVDYFLQFKEEWKVGLVLDYELANYLVEFNREPLERERAIIAGVLVGYEFANRWSVLLGSGIEFEKHKNILILRTSVEYEFELGKDWGLFPSLNYDFKQEYSTWSLNIGVSKRL
jgi:hypothetical protein